MWLTITHGVVGLAYLGLGVFCFFNEFWFHTGLYAGLGVAWSALAVLRYFTLDRKPSK